jgi:hypothetical protein
VTSLPVWSYRRSTVSQANTKGNDVSPVTWPSRPGPISPPSLIQRNATVIPNNTAVTTPKDKTAFFGRAKVADEPTPSPPPGDAFEVGLAVAVEKMVTKPDADVLDDEVISSTEVVVDVDMMDADVEVVEVEVVAMEVEVEVVMELVARMVAEVELLVVTAGGSVEEVVEVVAAGGIGGVVLCLDRAGKTSN